MPAGEDADERVEVHGHHRVSGDQYSVSAPIQADVAGSVPGAVNSLPAGSPGIPAWGSNASTTADRSDPAAIFLESVSEATRSRAPASDRGGSRTAVDIRPPGGSSSGCTNAGCPHRLANRGVARSGRDADGSTPWTPDERPVRIRTRPPR